MSKYDKMRAIMIVAFVSSYFIKIIPFQWFGITIASANIVDSKSIPKTTNGKFNVEHAFAYQRIVNPVLLGSEVEVTNYSPDRSYFTFVTRSGDVKNAQVEHTLWLYNMKEINNYIYGKGSRPEGRRLIRWRTSSRMITYGLLHRSSYIHSFRWSKNNKTIFFIGKTDREPDQIYEVSVDTGKIKQITKANGAIISFDINEEKNILLYLQRRVGAVLNERRLTSSLVGRKHLGELACLDCGYDGVHRAEWTHVVQKLSPGSTARVIGPAIVSGSQAGWPVSISPDGRLALVAPFPPEDINWDDAYERKELPGMPENPDDLKNIKMYASYATRIYMQFHLLDLSNGTMKPLFDAPAIFGLAQGRWSSDGKKIIVANAFLPTRGAMAENIPLRRKWPFIAEFDVADKKIQEIYPLIGDALDPEGGISHREVQIIDGNTIIVQRYNRISGKIEAIVLKRTGGKWTSGRDFSQNGERRLKILVKQGLNIPNDVFVVDLHTGVEHPLTNLNEYLKDVKFGKAVEIHWNDKHGGERVGALIFPVDYKQGKRYPLVLQLRGYFPGEFVVNGYGAVTAPFAARPLASRGIMVLQFGITPLNRPSSGMDKLFDDASDAVESAVAYLDRSGLIDPDRVGLTGWSASASPVQFVLTFSDTKIAASIIADGVSASMFGYANFFGFIRPGMNYVETLYKGAKPWGDTLQTWVKNNYTFHLDKIDTPILFHHYIPGAQNGWWDVYAILRRMGKPVEQWIYPDGEHSPLRPDQFMHAVQMVVDWYDYWLQNHMDQPSVRAEQYHRWQKMSENFSHKLTRNVE